MAPPATVPATAAALRAAGQQPRARGGQGFVAAAAAANAGGSAGEQAGGASQQGLHLLQRILSGIMAPYWEATPTAEAVVETLENWCPEAQIAFDHLAFRTFGVPGLGIGSMGQLFQDFKYTPRDELTFPAKKLRALWFAPPPGSELPRIFVSELKVEELSPEAQAVVQRYTSGTPGAQLLGKYGPMSSLCEVPPWETPTLSDYQLLAKESEYAAWVLAHGYALNHTTIAVHRLAGLEGGINALNEYLQGKGFLLNEEGGATKVSPDGLLLQGSTVADRVSYTFGDGQQDLIPGSYIEWAERLVLPENRHLQAGQIREHHRRDGFETANADKIFESTTLAAGQQGQAAG